MRSNKKIQKLFSALVLISITVLLIQLHHVNAQNTTINVSFDWVDGASSCSGTANGQTQAYYSGVAGDSATLHVTNASSTYSMTIDITESGQSAYSTTLSPGSSVSPVFPINSEITIQGNGTVCTSGHGGPGSFYVEAASGNMSCSIQNNQTWTVSFNYSNILGYATAYKDGTYVYQFNKSSVGAINTPLQFAAQSTPATYYLYYSSNNSGRLIGQASCPAKVTTSSPTSSTKPTSTTSNSPTNAAPSATPSTSQTSNTGTDPTSSNKTGVSHLTNNKPGSKKTTRLSPWTSLIILPVGVAFVVFWKFFPQLKTKLVKIK